jgi:hypothetical protein
LRDREPTSKVIRSLPIPRSQALARRERRDRLCKASETSEASEASEASKE